MRVRLLFSALLLGTLTNPTLAQTLSTASPPSTNSVQGASSDIAPTANKQHAAASAKFIPQRDYELIAPYWTAEGGWHTDLQLRNNLVKANLTVTPALRTPDGTEIPLKPVTILSGEVQSINLRDALADADPGLLGHANAYGSVVMRYHSYSLRNLYGSVMVHDTGHPIMYHLDALGEAPGDVVGSREGIWWLPTSATRDYLILTNQSNHSLEGTLWLYDASGKAWNQPVLLTPRQTERVSVRDLVTKAGLQGAYGGIKIDVPKGAGSLDTAHILFDEMAGFSATMKMFDYNPKSRIEERDYAARGIWTTRAPMLALSNPDPVLAFPKDTVLQPQLLIRNTTSKPAKVDLSFHWRGPTKDGRASIPELILAPYETRKVDIKNLQDKQTLPQDAYWAQVTLSTNTLPDEVMAVATSYDATLRYGAQTPFSDQLIAQLEGGQWQADSTHTSLIAAGNGGSRPVKAALTFFYNQGRQQYRMEQVIAPDDQLWVNVNDLIRNQVPDKDGNIIPGDVTSGAYQLREISQPEQNFLYEGKVITDKTYGHTTYGCMICCGYNADYGGPYLVEDPTAVAVGDSAPVDVWAVNACGGTANLIDSYFPTWSTLNTAILTAVPRSVHGVSPGSTLIRANATRLPLGDGEDSRTGCPMGPAQGQGTGNVQVPTSLKVLSATYMPAGTANTSGCKPGFYGFQVDIEYQVLDQWTHPIANANMTPQEKLSGSTGYTNIGPTRVPGTSLNTAADGTYYDAPVGVCGIAPFTATETQSVQILWNGQPYPVRAQTFTFTGTNAGTGSVKNNIGDINVTH